MLTTLSTSLIAINAKVQEFDINNASSQKERDFIHVEFIFMGQLGCSYFEFKIKLIRLGLLSKTKIPLFELTTYDSQTRIIIITPKNQL